MAFGVAMGPFNSAGIEGSPPPRRARAMTARPMWGRTNRGPREQTELDPGIWGGGLEPDAHLSVPPSAPALSCFQAFLCRSLH